MLHTQILLVDDDTDDQEFFGEALELISDRFNLRLAENGRVALEVLSGGDWRPDLIFLDWNMPVMNGEQFLEEVKQRHDLQNIPVVIISTSSHSYTKEAAARLGAARFITKPNNFQALVNELAEVIRAFQT